MEGEFISFFVILLAGLFFSGVFNRLHLPWVSALIIAGIIAGPHGLDLLQINGTLSFLGEIGLVFLMFMAGLETQIHTLRNHFIKILIIALLITAVPAVVGFGTGFLFGYPIHTNILLAIIFISSSVAVIIPSLQANDLFAIRTGRIIVGIAVLADITSLIALSFFLQAIDPITELSPWVLHGLLLVALIGLRFFIPQIYSFLKHLSGTKDVFEHELRLVFTILLGTVIVFELLGLHSIVAGFFAGLVLSGTMKSHIIKDKLHTLSYGVFIPVFFVIVGANVNITEILNIDGGFAFIAVLVIGLLVAKIGSGFMGGRLTGFGKKQSTLIGVSLIPQLSTTLAASFVAFEMNIFDDSILTAIILLTVITTLIAPFAIHQTGKRLRRGLAREPEMV